MKHSLVEIIGTFFLTLTICLITQPLGIGLMFTALIYMGGHVSGGHYNPALSLTMFLEGKLSQRQLFFYIGAQCIGSVLACMLYYLLSESTFAPIPAQQVLSWEAILIEGLFTFVLCAVMITLYRKHTDASSMHGVIMGLVLTALIFTGGDISGAILNPAVGTASILFDCFMGGESFGLLPIYLVGPFAGSIAAWYFQRYLTISEQK